MAKEPVPLNSIPVSSHNHVKMEEGPIPLLRPSNMVYVKQEQQEPTEAGSSTVVLEKEGEGILPLLPDFEKEKEGEPRFLKSVNDLHGLSVVLSTFRCQWEELQKHLDFIQNSMDSITKQLDAKHIEQLLQEQQQHQMVVVPATDVVASHTPSALLPDSENLSVVGSSQALNKADKDSSQSELKFLCQTMGSRCLRRYIIFHLSESAKLREEVPAALKNAPNPPKLVLECIGRFYLQGSKAYTKDSPMVSSRQAAVLILECFLLMGCTEIEPSVKEEAELAAVAWRKRLISEGGISKADEMDARGLLLFVGCFGIPTAFGNEDINSLIQLSNPIEIADALGRSSFLRERIPEIIQGMVKSQMSIEAVNVAYAFGIEDKFPPKNILMSFLRESKQAWKKTRSETQGLPSLLKVANEKQLATLKAIIKCLEDHKLDAEKLLPGWKIDERISNLEKEIADLDKKLDEKARSKRKADESVFSKKLKIQDVKYPRHSAKASPLVPPIIGSDNNNLYDGLTSKNFLDSGFPGMLNGYAAISSNSVALPDGQSGGLLAGNVLGTMAAEMGSGVNAGVGVGSGSGIFAGCGALSAASLAGIAGLAPGGDGILQANTGGPYGWYGHGAFIDNSVGQSLAGQPSSMGKGLMGPSPSGKPGFPGLPGAQTGGNTNQSSGSNLYQFADAVLEGESYHSSSSHAINPLPPTRHSSFLY